MTELPVIRLKIARRSSHPWIFQKMVEKPDKRPPPGTVVEVRDRDGRFAGRGFYNGHSRIALRILTADESEAVDAEFFDGKISQAISLRRDVLRLDESTDAYRLVHSEADGLSGLVVDRFASTLVMEFFSAGMFKQRDAVMAALERHYPGSRYYWFAEEHVCKQESFDCRPPDPPEPGVITENGVRFRVAPGSKHKTGFFLDQRDNRRELASLCEGKRVLDLCCNTGGFAVYALAQGKATEAVGIDLDEDALELARGNAGLNRVQGRFIQSDMFTWLRDVLPNGKRFDVVVLDPAKQTRDRDDIDRALRRYLDMNRLALQIVEPGGVYLTCSCTGLVQEEQFLDMLRRAAWQASRTVQVIKVAGAGADHPFMAHVPEGRYLKAAFCRVF